MSDLNNETENTFLDIDQFKERAKSDSDMHDKLIKLSNVSISECAIDQLSEEEKSIVKETGSEIVLSFVISDNSVDRDSDKINTDGWNLKNFKKNPVVPWAHNYSTLPVARAVKTFVEDKKLKSVAAFTPPEIYAFGDTVAKMYQNKFLNAVSVGFSPIKFSFVDDEKRKFGIDFEEQELLEYSAVPIPANPNALIQARSLKINTAPYYEWAEKALEELGGLAFSKEYLEQIRKCADPKQREILIFRPFEKVISGPKGELNESSTENEDTQKNLSLSQEEKDEIFQDSGKYLQGYLDGTNECFDEKKYKEIRDFIGDELGMSIPEYEHFKSQPLKSENGIAKAKFDHASLDLNFFSDQELFIAGLELLEESSSKLFEKRIDFFGVFKDDLERIKEMFLSFETEEKNQSEDDFIIQLEDEDEESEAKNIDAGADQLIEIDPEDLLDLKDAVKNIVCDAFKTFKENEIKAQKGVLD